MDRSHVQVKVIFITSCCISLINNTQTRDLHLCTTKKTLQPNCLKTSCHCEMTECVWQVKTERKNYLLQSWHSRWILLPQSTFTCWGPKPSLMGAQTLTQPGADAEPRGVCSVFSSRFHLVLQLAAVRTPRATVVIGSKHTGSSMRTALHWGVGGSIKTDLKTKRALAIFCLRWHIRIRGIR